MYLRSRIRLLVMLKQDTCTYGFQWNFTCNLRFFW